MPVNHHSIYQYFCSKVELNIFSSNVFIKDTVPENNTLSRIHSRIHLLQDPELKGKQEHNKKERL